MNNFKKENDRNQKSMNSNSSCNDKSKTCSDKNLDKGKERFWDNNKAEKNKFEHKTGHKDQEVGGKRVPSEKKHTSTPEKKRNNY